MIHKAAEKLVMDQETKILYQTNEEVCVKYRSLILRILLRNGFAERINCVPKSEVAKFGI